MSESGRMCLVGQRRGEIPNEASPSWRCSARESSSASDKRQNMSTVHSAGAVRRQSWRVLTLCEVERHRLQRSTEQGQVRISARCASEKRNYPTARALAVACRGVGSGTLAFHQLACMEQSTPIAFRCVTNLTSHDSTSPCRPSFHASLRGGCICFGCTANQCSCH